jgi:septin family protein
LLPAAACPAGESGLGKTTFIQNLTSSFRVVNGARVQDGSCTTLSQFQADPDSLRTVLEPMDIPESSRRLMISIQVCSSKGSKYIGLRACAALGGMF